MSRDLEDLETGKFVFHYPGEDPAEPKPRPVSKPEPVPEPEPEPEPEVIPVKEPEMAEPEEEEPEEEAEYEEDGEDDHELRFGGFFRFIISAAVTAVVLYALFSYVLGEFNCYDNRMYPFLNDGDIVFTFRLASYDTGDVVLYRNPDTGNTAVSRIAAIGTNTIDISDAGDVMINGTRSSLTVYEPTPKAHTAGISYPYQMSADGYFLLNDHREVEIDSRQFGAVGKDNLLGKVLLVIRWKGF